MGLFGYSLVKNSLKNKLYQAFLSLGVKFTEYDKNGTTYIEKGYNLNSDVYSVISQKSSEVTRIPFFVKKVKDKGNLKKYYQTKSNLDYLKKSIYEVKALDNEYLDMPLPKPNKHQSWSEFFALYQVFMDLTGNAYIYLLAPEEGANAGAPLEIYLLPSHLIQIVLKDNIDILTEENPVSHYILIEGAKLVKYKAEEVIHIKLPNPNFDFNGSHLYGQSPLRAVLYNLQSSNSAHYLNAKTLANGGSFGFISTKEPLTEAQAKSLKDSLIDMDNNQARLSNLAGSSKEVVFTRISLTTDELKPFDYLEYDQKAICNALHWDDKLLNSDDGAKYDNYKTALKRCITIGVSPTLRLLEDAFNNELLPRYKAYKGTVFVFDETELPELQEDMERLTKWLNDCLDRGVINRNEYRLVLKYPEINTPEMNTYTVGMNVIPLLDAVSDVEGEI